MTALIDDPSRAVRRALAEALGGSSRAPRHLIVALASDEPEVAAAVLQRSPVLSASDLVNCVAAGDRAAQCALARRPKLSPSAGAALIEIGEREAILALLGNLDVELSANSLARAFARFSDDAEVRKALLARPALPSSLKADILITTAKALTGFVAETGWLARGRAGRIAREAQNDALCAIAFDCPADERSGFVRNLIERGVVTPSLLLRSLLSGSGDLFAEALAQLSGLSFRRVAAFALAPYGEGFAAAARRAGLPSQLLPAFRAALAALRTDCSAGGHRLKQALIEKVIAACEERNDPALDNVLSLLWRFAAEAAKEDASGFAGRAGAAAFVERLPPSLDFSPAANDDNTAPLLAIELLPPPHPDAAPPVMIPLLEDRSEDAAPPVELPTYLIAALDDAA